MADQEAPQPPLNREQRRAQRFHRHSTARQDNLQTQRQNSSGFLGTPPVPLREEPPEEQATAEEGGPGTGGATESAERVKHHEGQHLGNQPNS